MSLIINLPTVGWTVQTEDTHTLIPKSGIHNINKIYFNRNIFFALLTMMNEMNLFGYL